MKLLTAAEMRDLDRRTIEEIGIPGVVLMENAGAAAAGEIDRRFRALHPGPVLILAGKGNNGGDGYVVARHLMNRGWQVRTLVLSRPEQITGDAAVHLEALLHSDGDVRFAPEVNDFIPALPGLSPRLLVDALLGTGLADEVRGHFAVAIEWINASGRPVVALDIPSGVNATTGGRMGTAVRADVTVTFAFAKVGHAVHPGAWLAGDLVVAEIGIPLSLAVQMGDGHLYIDGEQARHLLPSRPATGHKGTFGHLLTVAGSIGKSGAAAMTAMGGLRVGSGLSTVACPAAIHDVLAVKLTEAMTYPLPDHNGALNLQSLDDIRRLWEDKRALALGPGLGMAAETVELVRQVVRECPLPVVLDADGLNAIADCPEILLERTARTVLTPHPGEMARLIGGTVAQVEGDRIGIARAFARQHKVVLVLKGAATVTALPDGRVRINGSGNPGLASGGMGDVLTGMIGGLLAQGLPPEDAAVLGVYLHGRAADHLRLRLGEAGMTATDLLTEIPAARNKLSGVHHA